MYESSQPFEFENESELKSAFAYLLVKTNDKFKAALQLVQNDIPKALWIAQHWANDVEVLQAKVSLIEAGDDMAMLPTKADLARSLWEMGHSCEHADDRIKALKLFGDVCGYIDKPAPVTTVTVNQNKVMVVEDHGNNDDWQAKAIAQQQNLINGNFIEHDARPN
jgi:hypothetical protein